MAAERPPLPVTVIVQIPAATGVTVSVPVVVAGALAMVTPFATHGDTPKLPVFACDTAAFCANVGPTAVNDRTAGVTTTGPGADVGAAVGDAVGATVGTGVGDGFAVGTAVGTGVGDGFAVGPVDAVGAAVGVGLVDGLTDGVDVGDPVGPDVGEPVGLDDDFGPGTPIVLDTGIGAKAPTAPPPPPPQPARVTDAAPATAIPENT